MLDVEDDEIDEEEEMGRNVIVLEDTHWTPRCRAPHPPVAACGVAVAPVVLAVPFRKRPGVPIWGPGPGGRSIGISISCASVGPASAAEQLLAASTVSVLSVADTAFSATHLGRSAITRLLQRSASQ